jgi:PKHD-type hydroxylase
VYATRKLSMSMLLNTPGVDFEGGDFQTFFAKETDVSLKRGQILIFPSFIVHRVKPVTKGIRKSLVIWVTGPGFK